MNDTKYIQEMRNNIKTLFTLEKERKLINKEWRETTQKIRELNNYLIQNEK